MSGQQSKRDWEFERDRQDRQLALEHEIEHQEAERSRLQQLEDRIRELEAQVKDLKRKEFDRFWRGENL